MNEACAISIKFSVVNFVTYCSLLFFPPDAPISLTTTAMWLPGVPGGSASTFALLCCWNLWKHRNGVVFHALRPDLLSLRRACRDDAFAWRVRLPGELAGHSGHWVSRFLSWSFCPAYVTPPPRPVPLGLLLCLYIAVKTLTFGPFEYKIQVENLSPRWK